MSGNATSEVTVEAAFGFAPFAPANFTPLATVTLGEEPLVTETGEPLVTETGEPLVAATVASSRNRLRKLSTHLKVGDEGTCDMVLDNRDRALEPGYSGSPYWPYVVPNTPIRVLSGASTLFHGFIDSITPVYALGPVGDATVNIHCTDMTKMLARRTLRHPFDAEVAADGPIHWWPLGEAPNSTTFGDQGSQPFYAPGRFHQTVVLGGEPVIKASARTSMLATEVTAANAHITSPAVWTVEVICDTIKEPAPYSNTVAVAEFGPVKCLVYMLDPVTPVAQIRVGDGSPVPLGTGSSFLDEGPHVLAVTFDGSRFRFFFNGVSLSTPGGYYNYAPGAIRLPLNSMKVGGRLIAGLATPTATAQVGHTIIYDRVLSDARLLAHVQAARAPWKGDSTGSRVDRILAQVGVPTGFRLIDTGITTGLPALEEPIDGKTALELARQAEVTEGGRMYAKPHGEWRFTNRRYDEGGVVAMIVGDGPGELPYTSVAATFSEDGLVNESTVTRQGGNPQTYRDPLLDPLAPIFSSDLTSTLYATDAEAFDAAAYRVTQNSEVRYRFESVTLPALRSAALMNAARARQVGEKVTVRRRPPGGGTPQEETAVVDGIAHDIDLQVPSWFTTFALVPLDPNLYWIIEDPVAGGIDGDAVLSF